VAYFPELNFKGIEKPLVQIIEESTGEALYTTRVRGRSYRPKVFTKGKYTIRVGEDLPILKSVKGVRSVAANSKKKLSISIR
jgi:hypothetical protein